MGRKLSIRGLVALTLAAALFFHALPGPVRAAELVTGQYLLGCGGVFLGIWEDGWVTAVPEESAKPWTLTAEGETVTLTDPNGVTVCPGPEGLSAGPGSWTVTREKDCFRFHSLWEGVPVVLAANVYAGGRFRAVPEEDAAASPDIYLPDFTLHPRDPEIPEETTVPTEAAVPEPSLPPELPWRVYFGRLHSHSEISDGPEPVEVLFSRAREAGLDFYAVTDHSDSFDNDTLGSLDADGTALSTQWAAGKAAAGEASSEDFLGLYGFEMSWPRSRQLGHIAVLGTPGWLSRNQEDFAENPEALTAFYDALGALSGSVGIFAHPGEDSGNFEGFRHRTAARDQGMCLVEVGGEEGFDLSGYLLALEQGWHVAPAVSRHREDRPGRARTAVLAEDLSEKALLEAILHRRAYAAADEDLQVYFESGGVPMGSVAQAASGTALCITVYDPTEDGAQVEVLGSNAQVLARAEVEGHGETVRVSLGTPPDFCFLRVTQADGDEAVTAPIWFTRATDMGIADFRTDTQVPTKGKPLSLTLSLYNKEAVAFLADTAVFSANGQVIHAVNLEPIPGGGSWTYSFSYTPTQIGLTDLRAVVTGTVAGEIRTYEKVLTLRIRMEDSVTGILVDGSHGGSISYDRLAEIAADANASVKVADRLTREDFQSAQLLIIPAGSRALEPEFVELAAEFVKNGGNLILCGRADKFDDDLHWSAEGNKLLKRLGLTLRLQDDTALDDRHNQGAPERLAAKICNPEEAFCAGISGAQYYLQDAGSTVSGGTWLVRGFDTARSEDLDGDGGGYDPVLLAREESVFGGWVLAAGGDFLADAALPRQADYWDEGTVNRRILENLLKLKPRTLALSTIQEARQSRDGQVLRIRGYVTAGTANARTRFPEMIYIQNESGGIAVTDFREEGVEVGTALELIGQRCTAAGNPALKLLEYRRTGEDAYRFDPGNSRHADAMDYETHGGELLQVEGTVKALTKTADGKGLSRLTLADARGDKGEILIEPCILSGSTGKNDLALEIRKGSTVRARGILHLDEGGNPVLRVRNCDEVVEIPPVTNPQTGDHIGFAGLVLLLSGKALRTLRKKHKKPD